jgi:type II secretory pathway predicted ATPase ExeA
VEAIYGVTNGVPRLVNSLATNCLLYACEKKQRHFSLATVTVQEFYRGLALELGEEPKHKKVDLFHQIQSAIGSMYYERRLTPVIILDEIHMASNKLLEDLK